MGTKFMTNIFTTEGIKQIKQEIFTVKNIKKQYHDFTVKLSKIKTLNNILDVKNLPNDVSISTMTVVCSIKTLFNVENIAKYLDLSYNFIDSIKYGSSGMIYRTLHPKQTKGKKKNIKPRKSFYNQVSLLIQIKNFIKINIKLFTNGSIQMTGCKNINSALWVLDQLFGILKKEKYIMNKSYTQIIPCQFSDNPTQLDIEKINNLKIVMINSGFNIGFKINREKLYETLVVNKIDSTYDPTRHACVNIKHMTNNDKLISIFVFDSGAIIITGANTCQQIISGYKFINVYLINNYKKIVKRDINIKKIDL
jgi:TATA-box binding protein (TBP) (component of TFIID and TFIIIB)